MPVSPPISSFTSERMVFKGRPPNVTSSSPSQLHSISISRGSGMNSRAPSHRRRPEGSSTVPAPCRCIDRPASRTFRRLPLVCRPSPPDFGPCIAAPAIERHLQGRVGWAVLHETVGLKPENALLRECGRFIVKRTIRESQDRAALDQVARRLLADLAVGDRCPSRDLSTRKPRKFPSISRIRIGAASTAHDQSSAAITTKNSNCFVFMSVILYSFSGFQPNPVW